MARYSAHDSALQSTSGEAASHIRLERRDEVSDALKKLDSWIEKEGYKGWDPHDALNSPLLKRLTFGTWPLSVVFVQLLRRSPVNPRPLLGIPKSYNPKAMGLFLESYSHDFLVNRGQKALERMTFFIDWLSENAISGYSGPCWGYNFDWPNRAFFAQKQTPTIVNTAFVALSFLAAEEALASSELPCGPNQGVRREALSVARGACEFILRDLHISRVSDREICFSYTPMDWRFVHNANLMGAWLLAAVFRRSSEKELADCARAAARFTTNRQRSDGSWPYGVEARDHWVDNFHTGFVLRALREIDRNLQADECEGAALKGYWFWKAKMFDGDYIPKYYLHQKYPVDIHCVAQAILTFLEFSDVDSEALSAATRVCLWAINRMQDDRGFFHYQIHRFHQVRIPYMRWGQAWMHLALTKLIDNGRQAGAEASRLSYEQQ